MPSSSAAQRSCATLRDRIPEIVAEWEKAVDCPPWSGLSLRDRVDHLPNFLRALFDWTICDDLNGPARPFLEAAAHHGTQRRTLGLDYDIIMRESAILRNVIWTSAQKALTEPHAMVMVDAALTVGLMASLRGYSKVELVASGRWEESLQQIANEWAADLLPRGG